MKKAKFKDDYKMIAGSCIGHYDESNKQCELCKILNKCKDRTNRKIYPKSQKQVVQLLGKLKK